MTAVKPPPASPQETLVTKRRKKRKPRPPFQQVTRIPPYWPDDWVKIKDFDPKNDLSGKIKRVKSLTASITETDQKAAVWRVHFDNGQSLEWHSVERYATEEEVKKVLARMPK